MEDEIRAGLQARKKHLPASLLYDDLGSTLFEAITHLPEYGVARADEHLLLTHIDTCIASLAGAIDVVELGPGHGRKAKVIMASILRRQSSARYFAVDVSGEALRECMRTLSDFPNLETVPLEATFIDGLKKVPRSPVGHRRLVLFLGSNLSNFERDEVARFFQDVRGTLTAGDALLISADLEKPIAKLLAAYDDSLGVTAAFTKNALARLNRDYGANFDIQNFAYDCRWNAEKRRVEMHLRALRACAVDIQRLQFKVDLAGGESILVESSHRFTAAELSSLAAEAKLGEQCVFINETWPLALSLFVAV